jgi:hypothetical protein
MGRTLARKRGDSSPMSFAPRTFTTSMLVRAERHEEMRMQPTNPNAARGSFGARNRGEGGLNLYGLWGSLPHGVSYADFFLAGRSFDLFSQNQRIQTVNAHIRAGFSIGHSIECVFIFWRLSAPPNTLGGSPRGASKSRSSQSRPSARLKKSPRNSGWGVGRRTPSTRQQDDDRAYDHEIS